MTLYFGASWDSPQLDDATQAATPIGQPCTICREPVADGDRGLISFVITDTGTKTEPIHAECQLLGIIGHQFGVCTCTGYDTTSRDAARELWRRLHNTKAGR